MFFGAGRTLEEPKKPEKYESVPKEVLKIPTLELPNRG